jgi:hypothetical protein
VHQQQTVLTRTPWGGRRQHLDAAVGQKPATPPAPSSSRAPMPSLGPPL